jgi:hypothetical protein
MVWVKYCRKNHTPHNCNHFPDSVNSMSSVNSVNSGFRSDSVREKSVSNSVDSVNSGTSVLNSVKDSGKIPENSGFREGFRSDSVRIPQKPVGMLMPVLRNSVRRVRRFSVPKDDFDEDESKESGSGNSDWSGTTLVVLFFIGIAGVVGYQIWQRLQEKASQSQSQSLTYYSGQTDYSQLASVESNVLNAISNFQPTFKE